MSALIEVPWQKGQYLTPDTVDLFAAAGELVGAELEFTDTWRSYALQKYYRTGWELGLPGFNYASDPDDPKAQNAHMRGAAGDLKRTDAAVQAACRQVGLVRDASEPWHWNNPRWAAMPIIRTLVLAAAGGVTPIREDDDMPKYGITSLADNPRSMVFYGPGMQPLDIPNTIWLQVLTKYAEALNANREPVLTSAQWQLVREATADQPSPETIKRLADACAAEMKDERLAGFYAKVEPA